MSDIRSECSGQWPRHFDQSHIGYTDKETIIKNCHKAVKMQLGAVYCAPYQLPYVKPIIKGSGVELGLGISYPRGIDTPKVKAFAAKEFVKEDVDTIDFIMNYRALKEGGVDMVKEEVKLLREAAPGIILKMIIEVCMLTDEQIDTACAIGVENGIDYIKSSTGNLEGPTFAQVARIAKNLKGSDTKVKVAGVKFPRPQNALMYMLAGAERIGSQNAFEIIDGLQELKNAGIF